MQRSHAIFGGAGVKAGITLADKFKCAVSKKEENFYV